MNIHLIFIITYREIDKLVRVLLPKRVLLVYAVRTRLILFQYTIFYGVLRLWPPRLAQWWRFLIRKSTKINLQKMVKGTYFFFSRSYLTAPKKIWKEGEAHCRDSPLPTFHGPRFGAGSYCSFQPLVAYSIGCLGSGNCQNCQQCIGHCQLPSDSNSG